MIKKYYTESALDLSCLTDPVLVEQMESSVNKCVYHFEGMCNASHYCAEQQSTADGNCWCRKI